MAHFLKLTLTARDITRSCWNRLFFPLVLSLVMAGCATPQFIPETGNPQPSSSFSGTYQYTYLDSNDGVRIFTQSWLPGEEPKAVILFAHGAFVHSGNYRGFAEFFAANGYAVVALDLRNFGRSGGKGKRRGYVDSVQEYVDDLVLVHGHVLKQFPGKEVYLSGESLGGLVCILADATDRIDPAGLLLSAPGTFINVRYFGLRYPRWLARYFAWNLEIWGELFPYYPYWGIPPKAISSAKLMKQVRNDPYFTGPPVNAGLVSAVIASWRILEDNWQRINAPLFIAHGDRDNLVPVYASEKLVETAASDEKELRVYPNHYHALLLDSNSDIVMKDMLDWLESR